MLGRTLGRRTLKTSKRLAPMTRGGWDAPDVPLRKPYEVRRKVRKQYWKGV
jgi:hypothetical protein